MLLYLGGFKNPHINAVIFNKYKFIMENKIQELTDKSTMKGWKRK